MHTGTPPTPAVRLPHSPPLHGLGVSLQARQLAYPDAARGALQPWALRDFELELPAGQWTCLLGASGIGKSTILKYLAGLLPGDANVRTSDGRPLRGRVAYMDQSDLLLPWLRVRDNVEFGARLRGEPRRREQALALLEAVGLSEHAEVLPVKLSGGMRQRAALARTLMEAAPLVLMDEPFSALDALTRYRLQALAARLLKGRTVLLVTHDPHEALRLGHRIHVLGGEPAKLGPPLTPAGEAPRELNDPASRELLPTLLDALGMRRADT